MMITLRIASILALFALCVLPLAATLVLQYPDERHYTDGAMKMLQDHDWLVPKTPVDDSNHWEPRFKKPPLAYWLTAASFFAFGVTPFAARLPFLMACLGTLFLTWKLARRLTGSDTTARLAALILASAPQFLLAAARSMPDALLTCFLTLSAYGFLRLIVLEELTLSAFAMAYGGAALAALSKGLLGVAIVLFAWTFAFFRKRDTRDVLRLFHWPTLVFAALSVVAWFAAVFHRHGEAAWQGFFHDQVSYNLRGSWYSPAWHLPIYASILAINFLPWSLTSLEIWCRKIRHGLQPSGTLTSQFDVWGIARAFILSWTGTLVVVFSLGANLSLRYLMPVAPLLAIYLAQVMAQAEGVSRVFSPKKLLGIVWGLLIVVLLIGLLIACLWHDVSAASWLLACFAGALVLMRSGSETERVGVGILSIFPLLTLASFPIALPVPGEQIAQSLIEFATPKEVPILVAGKPAMASRLRLFLGSPATVVRTARIKGEHLQNYQAFVLPEEDAEILSLCGYQSRTVAAVPESPPLHRVLAVFGGQTVQRFYERFSERIVLVTKMPAAQQLPCRRTSH